jgi:putative transposase
MPRQARLDSPGTLHHVMLRGIDKQRIVVDSIDAEAFLTRLGEVAQATGTSVYAWALMPNHAHLLLRSGPVGLPSLMRRVLTGYAQHYNRRHRRHGHLFQNRYKSIVCDEDEYFRELVRYIHLNPLRAKLIGTLRELDRYPRAGHAVLMGRVQQDWQDRQHVLAWFGRGEAEALRAYRTFMAEGMAQGRRPELTGSGMVRSLGGWAEVRSIRARHVPTQTDERVLGSGAFVVRLLEEAEARVRAQFPVAVTLAKVRKYIEEACARAGISVEELRGGSRRKSVADLRGHVARQLIAQIGLPMAEVARQLGLTTSGVFRAIRREDRAGEDTYGRIVNLVKNVP